MSEKLFCPECNAPLNGDEQFCDNCGAKLNSIKKEDKKAPVEPSSGTIARNKKDDGNDISRNNVMGNINKSTTTNTSNSLTNNKVDNSTSNVSNNMSSIDNSTSTVHNNTTIVMGGKTESEFCQVCGNPIEEKHARCPKCGKSICFDCKVKGKNRCIECEKKAVNEYRMAFQELLFTTQGNIGIAGRQMMNRKAQELDVEDKKKAIEDELNEVYKEQTKAQQPTIVPTAPTKPVPPQEPQVRQQQTTVTAPETRDEEKGVGAIDGRKPLKAPITESSKNSGKGSGSKVWLFTATAVAVILLVYVLMGGKETDNKEVTPKTKTEQETPKAQPVVKENKEQKNDKKEDTVKATADTQKQEPKIAEKQEVKPIEKPVEPQKVDADYDAGMKAYEAKDGLKAIKHFKSSGSAESLYMLGIIYEKGCGRVPKNPLMARQNFKKAAEMGHEDAKAKL